MSGSLVILVAGPYRSGTDGDPARSQAIVEAMTARRLVKVVFANLAEIPAP